ncbi:MAG TPA: hypothetical protein DCY12_02420 [Candidatus Atribacteria bacterium]|nr:hypothetical protein [Candidatus Atribacteria bacterium]
MQQEIALEPQPFRYDNIADPEKFRFPKFLKSAIVLIILLFTSTITWAIDVPESTGNGWFVNMQQFSKGAHSSIQCSQCHGTMKENGKAHPDYKNSEKINSDTRRIYDYEKCKTCHANAHSRSSQGAHAEALIKEKTEGLPKDPITGEPRHAPLCGDCHSSHYDRSHLSRIELASIMIKRCATCHLQQVESYLENYHGKAAVQLAHPTAALCTDCHGAHTAISHKSDQNKLLSTCQACHPKAEPSFADIVIHFDKNAGDEKNISKLKSIKMIHWISLISLSFIIILLVAFYSHSFMLQLRKLHHHLRKKA